MTLFSILIANYNNGAFLTECLESMYAQTYPHWEIVLVDDASTDDSQGIYTGLDQDPRIRIYYNDTNRGVAYTKRRCIDLAQGEVLGFLDPDDTLHADALSIMVEKHEAYPNHSLIYSTHYICDQELNIQELAHWVGQIPEGQFSWQFSGFTISAFATFKKEKYLQTGGVSTWFLKAVDKDLYYKLEETGPVLFVDLPLYYYRYHEGSISLNQNVKKATLFDWAARAMVYARKNVPHHQLDGMHHKPSELAAGLVLTGFYLMFHNKRKEGWQVVRCAFATFKWRAVKGFWDLILRMIRLLKSKKQKA